MVGHAEIGAFVRDKKIHAICGFVTEYGMLKMGRTSIPAYRVRLANGTKTLILESDAEIIGRILDCRP